MDKNLYLYYRISNEFWLPISPVEPVPGSIISMEPGDDEQNAAPVVTNTKYIEKSTNLILKEAGDRFFLKTDKIIAYQLCTHNWLSRSIATSAFEHECNSIVNKFRADKKEALLSALYSDAAQLKGIAESICSYTFSDHFSLWFYNPHANYFHLHSSSFKSETDIIETDNNRSTLSEMLSGPDYISKPLAPDAINASQLHDMCMVNRIRIKAKESKGNLETICILSLYSKHDGYSLRTDTASFIKGIVSQHLAEYMTSYLSSYNCLLRELANNFVPGAMGSYLKKMVTVLRETLCYEAISIFLAEAGDRNSIRLWATTDCDVNDVPEEPVIYLSNTKSLTAAVYVENEVKISNCLDTDSRNSHIYDEATQNPPMSWIGVPISDADNTAFGVLRAKNKISHGEAVPLSGMDVDVLNDIASVLAYIVRLDQSIERIKSESQKKLKAKETENEEITEYMKTYRHEIRSPLIVVTQAANIIKKTLARNDVFKSPADMPKRLVEILTDLDMVGDRLVFVTNVLTFDAESLVKEIVETQVFKEVVAPILSFSQQYAKNRFKTLTVDKDSLFVSNVICDPNAAQMVFHILVDNAIKYTKEKGSIKIYGREESTYCSIIIDNYGLAVLDEEKEMIFNKFGRGHYAEEKKIEGSGIGLYLGLNVMKLNNGALLLTNLANPTRFEIRINKKGTVR